MNCIAARDAEKPINSMTHAAIICGQYEIFAQCVDS